MASVKVTLDTRARKQDGTYPLKIVVSHHGQTARHSLGISIRRDEWDARRSLVVNHPNKAFLNSVVLQTITEWQQALLSILNTGQQKTATAIELRDLIVRTLHPEEEKPVTFTEWYKHFQDTHTNARTRDIYKATWVQISRYDQNAAHLDFSDISKAWLDGFFRWCSSTSPSINARNIHLRNIRAVFNDALDNEITTLYPFRRYRITPVATPKRNLSSEELRKIFTADVEPWRQRYFDAFRLCFLLIGINIVDLCNLTASSYCNGRIQFNRRKTHRLYNIKVEPEAAEIIDRYRGQSLLLRWTEGCTGYRHFAMRVNQELPDKITTYWARHSWATIAASLDIPDDVISQALGHTSHNATTSVYIQRDQKKVDIANRRVIDWVLYGKK